MNAPILDHMAAVSDPIRCRLLRLLDRQELTVSELCTVLQLPQSTVSRHLKTLSDDDWVASRRDGTSRYYGMGLEALPADAQELWQLVRQQVAASPAAQHDDRRLKAVLDARRSKSRDFFASSAGQWERLRADLFGDRFHLHALLGLLDENAVVGDLGCGTGVIADALAPHVGRVLAIDGSAEMLQTARRRVRGHANVELRRGELEALPIDDAALDAAVLILVLHYVPEPSRVLAQVAGALKPGGRIVVADMFGHEREEYQQQMGHVWLGFSARQVTRLLEGAGFERVKVSPLPTDQEAKGPALFVAVARRIR
jgi:ArsR family transcriptional regulator